MSELIFEQNETVGILRLNRPERRNALNRTILEAITEKVRALADDRSVRVLVITGSGGQAFCAGADLKERRGMSPQEVEAFIPLIRDTMTAVANFPRPSIAAIDGVALGGGLELALGCDLRVAGRGATLGLPEVSLAIIPGAGGTQRLPRLIGLGHARDLILSGRRIDVDEALSMGLINRIAPAGGALETALEWAQQIARNGPLALEAAKDALDHGLHLSLADGLDHELACYNRIIPTEDRLEALEAFAQKRSPQFQGK